MIIAKKTYDSFFVGGIAKILQCVPVVRQRVIDIILVIYYIGCIEKRKGNNH